MQQKLHDAWIKKRHAKKACALLLAAAATLLNGCGTIPDARAALRAYETRLEDPEFVGPHGPLTQEHGQRIIARLEARQKTRSDILERHLAFEQAISNLPLVVGNKVTLLENGAATYSAMLTAIHDAHDSINIDMYTFSAGPVGRMFADALIERQRHGVQVNLIYDSFGCFTTPASYFDHLRQNGIAVLEYRPMNPLLAKLHWTLTHRNHRKILIVDGRIAFTGGINISEVYASGVGSRAERRKPGTPPQYWRDTDVELNGPVVAVIQRLFINEWNYQKGSPLSPRDYFPSLKAQGDNIVRVIASVPERFSTIYVDLISAIVNSETNIYITDAYFAPDGQMQHALENAARRGVDVRLLLPSQSDESMVISAQHSHYEALLKSGIKIYEWQGQMLHAKTATIDGVWSTVGSSNLDWWSIARNNEINAIILSHSFGDEMNRMFRSDMENSTQIDLGQWQHRGLFERLEEAAARVIEPLL
jgi:cardiolipin synthase A/B